jgi:Voltage gated chloride channel
VRGSGASLGSTASTIALQAGVGIPAAAIVGMAAVVGGGTGAAMTAVTTIFRMTRDYGLVMPGIVVVALAIGMRRFLARESRYTPKLTGRRHFIPKRRDERRADRRAPAREHGVAPWGRGRLHGRQARRRRAVTAIVASGALLVGVPSREHLRDSVIESIRSFGE